ncbi:PID-CTERM protein-sorting domain-containing protein [Fulvitalea axinellae]|uniref:PID-CTERM protein-sorting domain-containing protein n=1 Tax=Fulvitalea axinellae TaxID=1182444 RepID=UPI0030CA3FC4
MVRSRKVAKLTLLSLILFAGSSYRNNTIAQDVTGLGPSQPSLMDASTESNDAGDPGDPGRPDGPDSPNVPIDGGASLLLAGGIALGGRQFLKHRKKEGKKS